MKKIILLTLTLFSFSFGQGVIEISNYFDFIALFKNDYSGKKYEFSLNNLELKSGHQKSILKKIEAWVGLPIINKITIVNLEKIDETFLKTLLAKIASSHLTELRLVNIDVKGDLILPSPLKYPNLKTLTIIDADLSIKTFNHLRGKYLPHLKNLTLNKCGLDSDFIEKMKHSELLKNLNYLDLSGNSFGNKIFTLFNYRHQSQLETLKLNNCKLKLTSKKSAFSSSFYQLINNDKSETPVVPWDSPHFSNLKTLELQHISDDQNQITQLYSTPRFKNLQVFVGFLPELSNKTFKSDKRNNKVKLNKFFHYYAKAGLHSEKLGFSVKSLKNLNSILDSNQRNLLTELTLSGNTWNKQLVTSLLANNLFPKLKAITIISPKMAPFEVDALIETFPQIYFSIKMYHDQELWPLID